MSIGYHGPLHDLIARFPLSNILGVFDPLRVFGNTLPALLVNLPEKTNLSLNRCNHESPSVNKLLRGKTD